MVAQKLDILITQNVYSTLEQCDAGVIVNIANRPSMYVILFNFSTGSRITSELFPNHF